LLKAAEIREKFIKYFEEREHKHLPSSSLVPHNDPSVLLTTAGMLQFKPVMFGLEAPKYKRVATYQKCCRTTDLDNVGKTPRHHTFFEMLGNFSFGDYYKREIIKWAWEFIINELGITYEKLSVTVHHKDQESYDIWNKEMGLPENKIVRLDDKDNFWAAGETGPCGFCSEIYYDMGPEYGDGTPDEKAGSDSDRFLEFWNLVFMEFNRREDGTLEPLPAKNIDTGMGLERVTSIVQGVSNNYEIDSFVTIMNKIAEISGKKYGDDKKTDLFFKIIADHIRATVFLTADGVRPGNVGREYVLRRIMRRAVRYGRLLEIQRPFLHELIPVVIELGKGAFPELTERYDHIVKVVTTEEELFSRTLNNGMKILSKITDSLKTGGQKMISGKDAFDLYDTYGFPLELTVEIATENGLEVDENEYKEEMKKQVERAREAHNAGSLNEVAVQMNLDNIPPTIFTGYEEYKTEARVLAISFSPDKK
jgi:alanyl-tRNA synthetase